MKKLIGFTLAEVMIAFTIIGVIMVFYVPVHKVVAAQYTTLAYSAWENLSLASKELLSGDYATSIGNEEKPALVYSNGELVLNPDDDVFCLCMAEVMNTTGRYCQPEAPYSSVSGSNPLEFKLASRDFEDQYSPNFVGTNGVKYFLSAHQAQNDSVASAYGYRVIAVDLTGKKKPNSEDSYPANHSGQPADIVYFIMLDNGAVFPIGVAATNRNYINARTIAYYFTSANIPPTSDLLEKKAKGCKNFTSGVGIENFHDIIFNPEKYTNDPEKDHIFEAGCNYWKENIEIQDPNDASEQLLTYSFKDAYCLQKGQQGVFKGYGCSDMYDKCDKTNEYHADQCVLEPVKPLYKVKI